MGRPIEFKSAEAIDAQHGRVTEMLGHGTHNQPAGTITDDTEMALCIADSLAARRGFDPADIADRFVAWLASGPFDIGLMTQDALTQLRQGTPWHEAGVDVWNSRPEGSNAGNGSVMRCAPYAIAFRHVGEELTHVSRLSSAITHADPRCQWGCVVLNRTLAALICDESEPLGTALDSASQVPDELRTALRQVQAVIVGDRDRSDLESTLSTSGYVVDSLQAGLYFGLTTDSIEHAIVQAVNSGGDTDTVGAITGAVAGARFGADGIPDRWTDEIEDTDRLERLAQELLTVPSNEGLIADDRSLLFKQQTIDRDDDELATSSTEQLDTIIDFVTEKMENDRRG
jgi:ADP-ribosylglycohydrolase